MAELVVACDRDEGVLGRLAEKAEINGNGEILPLVIDLANPSPDLGWGNAERDRFQARGRFDLVMALALIHHLAISNNIPLASIRRFFSPN